MFGKNEGRILERSNNKKDLREKGRRPSTEYGGRERMIFFCKREFLNLKGNDYEESRKRKQEFSNWKQSVFLG